MNQFMLKYGIATVALFACAVSAGTLKAATAAINEHLADPTDSKFEARGGLGFGGGGGGLGLGGGHGGGWNPALHGHESFTGPSVIALALPVSLILIVLLWISAYNTLRSPPPKIGYNAGIVEQAGWGGAQANIAGGYGGWESAGTEQQSALPSNLAASTIVQAASQGNAATVARSIDNMSQIVNSSIERQQKKFI